MMAVPRPRTSTGVRTLREALLEEVRALSEQIEAVEEDNRRLLERLVAGPPA